MDGMTVIAALTGFIIGMMFCFILLSIVFAVRLREDAAAKAFDDGYAAGKRDA